MQGSFRSSLSGKTLANGYRAAYFTTKADAKARVAMNKFSQNYLSKQMCDQCCAMQFRGAAPNPLFFKDFSPNPAYEMTVLDHDMYLRLSPQSISPWSAVEGWRLETVSWDLLHNVFLGVARDLVASSLKALVLLGCFDHYSNTRNEDMILKCVTVEMRRTCKNHGLLA